MAGENHVMLPLLFVFTVFFFLAVGAVVFLICASVSSTRPYALSAALWCAAWGPCAVALMMLAGLALIADAFITSSSSVQKLHAPRLPEGIGWVYVFAGAFGSGCVATAAAWLHQLFIHRLTFALFRLYTMVVVAGIGSVFGWCLSFYLLSNNVPHAWAWSGLAMLSLVAGFGMAAYRGAGKLRGQAPASFTFVSPEEFAGS